VLEFWNSTFGEIKKQWKLHLKFNGWELKDTSENSYRKMNIEDIPFL